MKKEREDLMKLAIKKKNIGALADLEKHMKIWGGLKKLSPKCFLDTPKGRLQEQ